MQRADLATVDPRRTCVVTNVESPGDRPGSTPVQLRTEAPHQHQHERGEMPLQNTRIRPRWASATSQSDRVTALHRHETASMGLRAGRLSGVGTEHARLVRLILLSYTRWPGRPGQAPWPSNATIAARARLTERQVERALAQLLEAEIITTRVGHRSGARRSVGRLIDVYLHEPCKALVPEAVDVASLWAVTKSLRARPAALVTAMVGAFMLASDASGGPIDEWSELGCSMADWRRFVGHADNAAWRKRVRELEDLGLLRREGHKIIVSPPRAWFSLMVDLADGEPSRVTALRPAPDTAHRDVKPELSVVERAPKRADPPPRAEVLPALPPIRLQWLDLRELSEEAGTGPSMGGLGWHGPPEPEPELCQYPRAAARS